MRQDLRSPVATVPARFYGARMTAGRFLRLLTMLAVLLMPLGMLAGEAAAMGHQTPAMAAAMSDHCAAMHHKRKKGDPAKGADCMIACAAIPADDAAYEPALLDPTAPPPPGLTPAEYGLHPEAETPPPRAT